MPGPRHLDNRRQLTPRDYASPAQDFGVAAEAAFVVPEGGDAVSMAIARGQHELVVRWNNTRRSVSAMTLRRRFGISKPVLSRIARGQRWAGETGFAALLYATGIITSP